MVLLCFLHKVKRGGGGETAGKLDKGHAKPVTTEVDPGAVRKAWPSWGKKGKRVTLLGHKNSKMERDWCLEAQTTEGWSER